MEIKNVLSYFFAEIPELETVVKEQCNNSFIDESDGNYVIWGMGIMPCIICLFEKFHSNRAILDKIFGFFEKMANADEEVKNILLYSVLEKLGDDKEILTLAESLMGQDTLKYSKRIESFLGR